MSGAFGRSLCRNLDLHQKGAVGAPATVEFVAGAFAVAIAVAIGADGCDERGCFGQGAVGGLHEFVIRNKAEGSWRVTRPLMSMVMPTRAKGRVALAPSESFEKSVARAMSRQPMAQER